MNHSTEVRSYVVKTSQGMHFKVEAYTAADAVTQVEIHFRGSSPLPQVKYVAPWQESDGLRAHQLVWK